MKESEIDVFISYKHDTSKSIADAVCNAMENRKIRCWYAPRDCGTGPYARAITTAINHCKAFVLILDKEASRSHSVLDEVEYAYKRLDNGLVIVPFKVDSHPITDEMMYYVKRMHWIDVMTSEIETKIEELVDSVAKHLEVHEVPDVPEVSRKKNDYLSITPSKEDEIKRNDAQTKFLNYYLKDVYDKVLRGKDAFNVLDIGSGAGRQIVTALEKRPGLNNIIGVDISDDVIDIANKNHGSEKISFHRVDCEDENFEENIREVMSAKGIDSFDLINISFLLMHLEDPSVPLRVLRKLLSPDGRIVIIDIDDGLLQTYPDPEKRFSRTLSVLSETSTSGYRKSGQEVYYLLRRADLSDIKLELNGLSTIGVPYDIKEHLFTTYIDLVPIVLAECIFLNPTDASGLKSKLEWFKKNREKMKEEFFSSEFMMVAGIKVFTAR